MEKLISSGNYQITYTDDTGDIINVSDDEDLQAAYEVAESSMGNQLKLNVQPRQEESNLDISFQVEKSDQMIKEDKMIVEPKEKNISEAPVGSSLIAP